MQEIMEKVQAVLGKYSDRLARCGIKLTASKRYFEAQVFERTGTGIFAMIDRMRDQKREKRYHHEKNRYYCIVLSVLPIDKDLVSRQHCREYAFVLQKVERAHIGLEPRKTAYDENALLSKIEKRIVKIVKKAERSTVRGMCKDTLFDVFRYVAMNKYAYKRCCLNKDRDTWGLIFVLSTGLLTLAVVFVLWILDKM